MTRLVEIFESTNGRLSFKRVSGFISLLTAIVLSFMFYNVEVVSLFIAYSAAMGGVGIFEKRVKGNVHKD